LHFQNDPKAQTKLVRCTAAASSMSPSTSPRLAAFRQWVAVELSADNKKQLLIPIGFAHGFMT
jgi:dTDP-4-dehydrorhamnose 3,5-epimerase-like enzyme